MSSRTFMVFQDSPLSKPLRSKVLRPNVLVKRCLTNNVTSSTGPTMIADLDKENFDPVTGERAGPSNPTNKKRKTSVLATKFQPLTEAKHAKKDPSSPPEKKKRKSSSSATLDLKAGKKYAKSLGSSRKGIKRAGSKKASLLPRLTEEDEVSRMLLTQEVIDSRCKELTLKPLADVSDAYDELCVLDTISAAAEAPDDRLEPRTVKAPSVEPEIRDYFEPSGSLFSKSSTSTRIRAMSEGAPEPRSFSTPERKQIYTAFIFSSPAAGSEIHYKPPNSRTYSPTRELA